jgi:hypothetical protein
MFVTSVSDRACARLAVFTLLAAAGAAQAQFSSDFESPAYNAAAAGTLLTGQQAWYLPAVAGSQDANVFTYAGNTLNIAANPNGGAQFEGGLGNATGPARAQHPVDFSAGGVWTASWDCTGKWQAALPAVDNLGSWSLQPSTTARYFQQLMDWGTVGNSYSGTLSPPPDLSATADHFHIHWGYFTAASPTVITFAVPSADWLNLPVDHWYHITCKWDFTAAQVLQVSIQDITAGTPTVTNDVSALGWYMQGGPNSTYPLPTDIRLFAGGAGDSSAWDNFSVAPFASPPACYANCDGNTTIPFLNVADFTCFLQKFAQGNAYANCDGSTSNPTLNVADFTCFLQKFAQGCSAP